MAAASCSRHGLVRRRASCRRSRSASCANLTRYRKTQIQERAREAQRGCTRRLQDTGIKLDCVASDMLGKSGRAMLDALVSGTHDPEVLAELAKGALRTKIPALREALEGRFDRPARAAGSAQILAHIDFLDEQIAPLSDAIEERIAPFRARASNCWTRSPASTSAPPRCSSPRSAPT